MHVRVSMCHSKQDVSAASYAAAADEHINTQYRTTSPVYTDRDYVVAEGSRWIEARTHRPF